MRFPGVFALLAILAMALTPAAGAQTTTERAAARGGLVAAVMPDELPLAAKAASGDISGFDIDIAREVARRLGRPLNLITPGWDAILSGNWDGAWDYAVASITPTPARAEKIDFAAVYRIDPAVVVVRKDETAIIAPEQASGRTIAVKGNTTFEKYLRHTLQLGPETAITFLIRDPKIRTLATNGAALDALVAKQADAAVTSQGVAEAAIRGGAPLKVVPRFLYFEQVAIATAKGDPEFDAAIAKAVQDMRNDGSLAALSIRWFGIDLGSITQ